MWKVTWESPRHVWVNADGFDFMGSLPEKVGNVVSTNREDLEQDKDTKRIARQYLPLGRTRTVVLATHPNGHSGCDSFGFTRYSVQ